MILTRPQHHMVEPGSSEAALWLLASGLRLPADPPVPRLSGAACPLGPASIAPRSARDPPLDPVPLPSYLPSPSLFQFTETCQDHHARPRSPSAQAPAGDYCRSAKAPASEHDVLPRSLMLHLPSDILHRQARGAPPFPMVPGQRRRRWSLRSWLLLSPLHAAATGFVAFVSTPLRGENCSVVEEASAQRRGAAQR